MYYEILIKRECRVQRLINQCLEDKNDEKVSQGYHCIEMINEAKLKENIAMYEKKKLDFLRRGNWIRKVKIN